MSRQKILVVRFSAFGDIVLTTPVVRCLKSQLDAEIHYLTKRAYVAAIGAHPAIDKLITIEKEVSEVADELRRVSYDQVVDLHHNLRSLQVKRIVKAPARAFHKLNIEKWILVNFKLDLLPAKHIVDRYMKTVRALNVTYDGKGLDFIVEAEAHSAVDRKLPPDPFAAIAIGAGLATKTLEVWQITELARSINGPVVLLGGPDDEAAGAAIADDVPTVVNLAGQSTLQESAATIERAAVLITPDTGLMHIGAALDTAIISIWGNTVPKFGMTPFFAANAKARHVIFEVGALPCRPCSKIGYNACPKGHFKCIREQPLEEIAALANNWMGTN